MDHIGKNISTFISEFSNYRLTADRYPTSMHVLIDKAVELKRSGDYRKSADIYIKLTRDSKTVYSGIIMYLYKVVASAGYLAEALRLLETGKLIYDYDPSPSHSIAGIPSNFDVHIHQLLSACQSEPKLQVYLKSISGNPRFEIEREYEQMLEELVDYMEVAKHFPR